MNQLPFKQSETVSNEYVLALFIVIVLLGAGLWALTRYLKSKGLIKLNNANGKRVQVTEQKVISHATKVYLIKVGDKEFLLTESNKNCSLTKAGLTTESADNAVRSVALADKTDSDGEVQDQ